MSKALGNRIQDASSQIPDMDFFSHPDPRSRGKKSNGAGSTTLVKGPSSAGVSPYISLKIKKRHYEHHMIETHR